MIPRLALYKNIVGKEVIEKIRAAAEPLRDKHVVHVNSTSSGGGVAEILNTLVFLMNDIGIITGWRIMFGSHSFFNITKSMHNSLQGKNWRITRNREEIYLEYCERNSIVHHLDKHDLVLIHDPQPLAMINNYVKKNYWIWRCHIDLSNPNKKTMDFFLPFIKRYDALIISSKKFKMGIDTPQFVIRPSIDPLSTKNKKISHQKARRLLFKRGIDLDKPIISQISRFDPWKNYYGVIRMFKKIREKSDAQLVLLGNMASDDPQGPLTYHKIMEKVENMDDVHVLTEHNDLLVNALQKESRFVFQNSIKEGFGLTVSEALWKETPVLGTNVGGIPLQVINGKTGFIMKDEKDGVNKAIKLLEDDELRTKMGRNGHMHVKDNFLITRHLHDYINLFKRFYPPPNLK